MRVALLVATMLPAVGTMLRAQVMTASVTTVELSAPDSLAYQAGMSPPAGFSIMVTACVGPLGCRTTIENPNAASPIPVELEWRLMQVNQVGTGDLGCVAMSPLLAWQSMPSAPVDVMDASVVAVPGTACVAVIEVRAVNVSWSLHRFTAPSTTYWRDVLLRTVEK